jgi:hypothetical protein
MMFFRWTRHDEIASTECGPALGDFHAWVLSLPWVVERPFSLGTPGVRSFAVDCEPLGRRQLWLVTGLGNSCGTGRLGITVLVPREAVKAIESTGQGRVLAPMPDGHALVTMHDSSCWRRQEIEALVIAAYCYAMS